MLLRRLQVGPAEARGSRWRQSWLQIPPQLATEFTGRSSDAGNPHVDSGVQFIPNNAVDQVEIKGMEYIQIVTAEVVTSRARGTQGITSFSKENDTRLIYFKDLIVAGCLILASGNHHCTLSKCSGGIYHYNTFVKAYDGKDVMYMDKRDTKSHIHLSGYDDRAASLKGSITALVPYVGPTGPATYVEEDGVAIGNEGDIIPYDSIFTGPFPASTLGVIISAYAERGAYAAAGAMAFGTIGAPRDPSGWSYDPEKLIPLPGSVLAE